MLRAGSCSRWYFASWTMPTTSRSCLDLLRPTVRRWPIGSRPPKALRASDSLMTTTRVEESVSRSVKSRPAMSRVRRVPKYPGETALK
jgi:hypothetical protein